MEVLWAVLGALLVTVVVVVCLVFFLVRPRLIAKVQDASEGLARELNGRPPLLASGAQCEACSDLARSALLGFGALGLTEQAVVFVSGGSGASVIIPRAAILETTVSTTFTWEKKTIRRARPMLLIKWRVGERPPVVVRSGDNQEEGETAESPFSSHPSEPAIAFTLNSPKQWAAALSSEHASSPDEMGR